MEIIIAKNAGFCFGVNNAIKLVYDIIDKESDNIFSLGPLIHNEQVVAYLSSKGVKTIKDVEEIEGKGHVIIRAHGVGPEIYKKIKEKDVKLIDATCPYVKKIHQLVKEKREESYQIVLVGDVNHPEVIGINGWCNGEAFIVNDVEDINALPDNLPNICLISQTTMSIDKWDAIKQAVIDRYDNVIVHDTICKTTSNNQSEAEEISKNVDLMIVIGSKNSSNTQKLFEICKKHCPQCYNIETSGDLPPVEINKYKKVGITAGSSTPDWIIKEVIYKMEELNKQAKEEVKEQEEKEVREEVKEEPKDQAVEEITEEITAEVQEEVQEEVREETGEHVKEVNFKEVYENSLVTLNTGEIIKGKIIGYNNAEVFVDMGYKSDGIIPLEEFSDDPDFDPEESLKVGQEIEVFIIRVNDGEGNVLLSKNKVSEIKSWKVIEEAYESKDPIKVKVVEVTKGGLIASFKGVRIFIPASHVSDRYIKDLSQYLMKTMDVRIIELNKQKKKVVGSQRVLLVERKKELERQFWSNVEVGKVYNGTVKSIVDFGAFVDVGGVDGLVHISELSWHRIKHPSEVLNVGDEVEVTVLDYDRESKRISLGYKKTEDNPWYNADIKYKAGENVTGKVVRLVPFGAFVELEKGVDGLVHISQISNVRIAKPSDVLKIGQQVEAKVLETDIEAEKISLSIKEVNPIDPEPEKVEQPKIENKRKEKVERKKQENPNEHVEDMHVKIGDILKDYNLDNNQDK